MAGTRQRDQGVGWGLIVPVKHLHLAKTRLGAYGDRARADLALAFALDLVEVALACPTVARVLVVTDDDRAARELVAVGAHVVRDQPDAGLNPALAHGADLLREQAPNTGVAAVSADLPAVRSADLADALAQVITRAFVTDRAAVGTTLLAAAAGHDLLPSYGPRSRLRHLASGAAELAGTPALRLDVDTPEDLAEAVRLGVGPRTAAAVAALVEQGAALVERETAAVHLQGGRSQA